MADKKISALTASTTPLAGTEVLPIVQGGITVKVSIANVTAGRAVDALTVSTTTGFKNTSAGSDIASPANGVILTDGANKNAIVQLGASGGLSTFVYEAGGAGWRRVAGLLTNGNSVVDVGNVVIGTAGKGIDFSANTNAPGMTSELLTWYEEGVFTPTVFGTGTAGTGTYTFQVGRYVRIGKVVQFQASLAWSAHTGTGNFGGVGGLPFSSASTADNYSIPSIYVSDLALTALNTIQGFIGPSTATISLRQVPTGGGAASVIPFDTSVSALLITGSYIAA